MRYFNYFTKDDRGAVTIDWVVLSGVVLAFALIISLISSNGALGEAVSKIARSLIMSTSN